MRLALSPIGWARRQAGTLIGNAPSIRDYRAQLRSGRTVWLWAGYLGLLILLAMSFYSSTVGSGRQSVAQLQDQLGSLYDSLMTMLGWMIVIFSPALTAFAIVQERDRKSLDLVFSAPVPPKYLLVGKMLSSFRYIWMLLVLALPVTAVCVVMGGATWMDVLGAYVALSAIGLTVTSIGLLISSLAGSVAAALISTYLAVGAYLLLLSFIWSMFMFRSYMGMMGRDLEAPFVVAMLPWGMAQNSQTYTVMFGAEVPNWVVAFGASLVICKFFLLAAGSALSPYGVADTKSLRIHGLLFLAVLGYAFGYMLGGSGGMFSTMGSGSGMDRSQLIAMIWILMPVLIAFPHLCCHHPAADRKYRSERLFSFKAAFIGNPDGSLIYIALMAAIYYGALRVGVWSNPSGTYLEGYRDGAMWLGAFFFFWWAAGRFMSSICRSLRTARVWHIALILGVLPTTLALLAITSFASGWTDTSAPGLIVLHPLWPLFNLELESAVPHAVALLAVGLALVYLAEFRYRPRRWNEVRPPTVKSESASLATQKPGLTVNVSYS